MSMACVCGVCAYRMSVACWKRLCMQEGMGGAREGDREGMAVKKRMDSWHAETGSTSTKLGIGSEA